MRRRSHHEKIDAVGHAFQVERTICFEGSPGMSLRDWFAGQPPTNCAQPQTTLTTLSFHYAARTPRKRGQRRVDIFDRACRMRGLAMFDLQTATNEDALAEWDRGGTVLSCEMGGLGPGHEQCMTQFALAMSLATTFYQHGYAKALEMLPIARRILVSKNFLILLPDDKWIWDDKEEAL